MAPRILIFSIAMGTDCSFYVKTIETPAGAFLALNDLAIGRVHRASSTMTVFFCKKGIRIFNPECILDISQRNLDTPKIMISSSNTTAESTAR